MSTTRRTAAILFLCAPLISCARTDSDKTAYRDAIRRQHDYYYVAPLENLFKRERLPDGSFNYVSRRSISGYTARFPSQKKKGVKRLFLIGGSVVELFDEKTLKNALSASLPGKEFEIIDCGLSAYDSSRDKLILEEVLGYEPDLIILMSGVNEGELIGAPTSRRTLWLGGIVLRGLWRLQPLRAYRLAAPALRPVDEPGRIAADFEANVRDMVREAKARGVPILLAALPWNARDMPPLGRLPLEDPAFFEAWLSFEEGDTAAAANRFGAFLNAAGEAPARRAERAFANYYLARSLDRNGIFDAAREHYLAALELEHPPMPAVNRALLRVSRELDVPLADIDAAFSRAGEHGIAGADLFEDDMHWERFLDPLIADVIVHSLYEDSRTHPSRFAPPAQWSAEAPTVEPERFRTASRTLSQRKEKAWLVFRYRAWSSELISHGGLSERVVAMMDMMHAAHPELLANVSELKAWLKDKLSENIWDSEGAENLDSRWPAMLGHVGESYLRRRNTSQAIRFFDEALKLDPGLTVLRLRRAVALARSGHGQEAFKELEAVEDRHTRLPEAAHYRKRLADLKVFPNTSPFRPIGKPSDLEREGDSVLKLDESRLNAAFIAFEKGDRKAAQELLLRVERMPPNRHLRLKMAQLYLRLKDRKRALESLSRANVSGMGRKDQILAAGLFEKLEAHERAMDAWGQAARSAPADSQAWIHRAENAEKAGKRTVALASLKKAAPLSTWGDDLSRIGHVYQQLKEYPLAIGSFRKAAAGSPGPGGAPALRDIGICLYLSGSPDRGLNNINEAIRRDPGLLSAYLSAGAIHEAGGDPGKALSVYENALKQRPKDGEKALREMITSERDRLRSPQQSEKTSRNKPD